MKFSHAEDFVDRYCHQWQDFELYEANASFEFEALASENSAKNEFETFLSANCIALDVSDVLSEQTTSERKDEKCVLNEFVISNFSKTRSEKTQKEVNKSQKKQVKKLEKRKLKAVKIFNEQLAGFIEEKEINQGALMAELMKNAERICVQKGKLMLYDNKTGCFENCDKQEFSTRLNSFFNKEVKFKTKYSEYIEAYKQILIQEDLKLEKEFFENRPLVNCLNGVIDVMTGELLSHSPEYHFKHCINANYNPGAECPRYLEYVYHLFDGDEELVQLLQVVQGYICSHYNNAKTAFLVYGEPHTGKSVFNNIMERIIGKNLVTHADLSYLCRQEYAASLAGKLLNVAPDLKNTPLRDVGFFKSLVSHDDTISTRALYSNPGEVRGETKMLFTSNHLIEFENTVGENDVHAVFNRLLYLPVQCKPIDESEENKHLSKELFEERDAIFTWGIEGLRKYIESGERFPKSVLSEQIKQLNIAKYCPEKIFFDDFLESEEKKSVSVSVVKELFAKFCSDIAIKRSNKSITQYIENVKGVEKTKRRINKEGDVCNTEKLIHVYAGIRLKNTY